MKKVTKSKKLSPHDLSINKSNFFQVILLLTVILASIIIIFSKI
ncbi:MAG: hypothetical protein WAV41_00235 [Microgenomates group bacterium]